MIAQGLMLSRELTAIYQGISTDPAFEEITGHFPIEDDEQLADLIEAEGRLRLRLNLPLTLGRYLDATPDLAQRAEPLDAAIDMALRFLARDGRGDEAAIEDLITQHPDFEEAIREAAALSNALWSTARVREQLAKSEIFELPCDFGPTLENGDQRYELQELLGQGAVGQVYLAVDRRLSEEGHPALVAIKVLPGEHRSAWARQQLIDEASKARRMDHPNVARVLDRGVSGHNKDFIVYEYVAGGDLGKWARRKKTLNVQGAVRIAARTARGVHAAHMAGLVHCDLKPNNVLLTTEVEPKVADFGIAIRSDEQSKSRQGEEGETDPLGNLAFMSPEQFRMEPGALTIPTDVYAMGGILYWLLTGQLPNGSSPEDIRHTHDPIQGRREPPSVREVRPEVDRDLEAICMRAMSVDANDRHGSAAGLADDLEAWLRVEPITWTRPSVLRRARLWVKRKPAQAVLTALMILLATASGVSLQHAREKRFEAAVLQDGLDREEQYRKDFRQNMGEVLEGIEASQKKGLSEQIFASVWVAEWLFGPTVLGEGVERQKLWEVRTKVVRDFLAEAEANGKADGFRSTMWESALCFWLIREGDHTEGLPMVTRNLEKWEAFLDPEDDWVLTIQAMQACAFVNRLTDPDAGDLDEKIRPADTNETARILEEADRVLNDIAPGSPMHRLVLDRMRLLYGPDLLNRPELAKTAADSLAKHRE